MSLLSDQVEKPFENLCLGPCWGPPPIPPAPPPSLARARPAPPPAGFQGRLTLCGHGHSAARSCGAHGVERAGRRVWAGSCREVVWGARLGVREVGTAPESSGERKREGNLKGAGGAWGAGGCRAAEARSRGSAAEETLAGGSSGEPAAVGGWARGCRPPGAPPAGLASSRESCGSSAACGPGEGPRWVRWTPPLTLSLGTAPRLCGRRPG